MPYPLVVAPFQKVRYQFDTGLPLYQLRLRILEFFVLIYPYCPKLTSNSYFIETALNHDTEFWTQMKNLAINNSISVHQWVRTKEKFEKQVWYTILFISIPLVRIFSFVLQQGEVNLEKSTITLKYAMDAERISDCYNNLTDDTLGSDEQFSVKYFRPKLFEISKSQNH